METIPSDIVESVDYVVSWTQIPH